MGFQPPLLLRARQGGVAPGTMPKVLHVTSRGRSSTILDEGPDSTIGIIQSFHALRAMCSGDSRGFARTRIVASRRFHIYRCAF